MQTNTCDKCKIVENSEDLIWLTAEDFEPKRGKILKPEANKYDAVCESCYQSLLMTRKEMVDQLVAEDVEDIGRWISEGDTEFLENVLRGEGWKGYNQLSDLEIAKEYQDRLNNREE